MLRNSLIVISGLIISTTPSKAQDVSAALPLSTSRINEIAVRWTAPEELPEALGRELEQTVHGFNQKRTDPARAHWREFLRRRELLGANFDAGLYVDLVLHRIAAARNDAINEASLRLRFYDAQETAVFEHLSTVDKQISIYAGEDNPRVPLREPQLADYADGVEPVTLGPAETAGMKELIASVQRWRERAPEITEARNAAHAEFVKAVAADAVLSEELHRLDAVLRAEIKTITVREVKP